MMYPMTIGFDELIVVLIPARYIVAQPDIGFVAASHQFLGGYRHQTVQSKARR